MNGAPRASFFFLAYSDFVHLYDVFGRLAHSTRTTLNLYQVRAACMHSSIKEWWVGNIPESGRIARCSGVRDVWRCEEASLVDDWMYVILYLMVPPVGEPGTEIQHSLWLYSCSTVFYTAAAIYLTQCIFSYLDFCTLVLTLQCASAEVLFCFILLRFKFQQGNHEKSEGEGVFYSCAFEVQG